MAESKWSDDPFLDALRQEGDPLADEAVARLIAEDGIAAVNSIFRTMRSDDDPVPEGAPAPFRDFIEKTRELPPGLDPERLERGGRAFLDHAVPAAVVLLAYSLPSGYAAPTLTHVLTVSDDLGTHPYKRLLGVIQLLVNISNAKAFDPNGRAVLAAQKMRLLHAGVRTVVPRYRPDFEAKHGKPVNHEDMLATIMAFSYLVIEGLRTLGAGYSPQEEEDFYYLWKIFAQMMGIHPPGKPESPESVPQTVAEAAEFYDSYRRRQYVGPDENPSGVRLTRVNLEMMRRLIPSFLRLFGLGLAPRIAMTDLLGPEGMAQRGVRPVAGHGLAKWLFTTTLRLIQDVDSALPNRFAAHLAHLLFQGMIDVGRGGEVTFLIPTDLASLHELAS